MRPLSSGVLAMTASVALSACGTSAPPPAPPSTSPPVLPVAAATPAVVDAEPVLSEKVDGATPAEVEKNALRVVLHRLVGPEWAEFMAPWHPTLPDGVLTWTGDTAATVALDEATTSNLLEAFEREPLQVTAPKRWQQLIRSALEAERRYLVCKQREHLLNRTCTQSPPSEVREAITNLSKRVVLEPHWADGVPVDADGRPLVDGAVHVWERTEEGLRPLAGLPLRVAWAEPEQSASPEVVLSGEEGLATLPLNGKWERAGVQPANTVLLGPLVALGAQPVAELSTRRLDLARMAVVSVEKASRQPAGDAVVTTALLRELWAHLEREPVRLPTVLSRRIQQEGAVSERTSQEIAHETQGQVDYLLVVESDSAFASQMGMGRTWYQARATVRLIEVWSRQTIDTYEVAHTESGIGDARADEAARAGLAMKIIAQLEPVKKTPQQSVVRER